MKRFTIPRVAHCSDGCRSQSLARPKTAHTIRRPTACWWGSSVSPNLPNRLDATPSWISVTRVVNLCSCR
jgi:hypothetical protein